jgi:hypothetical protein
MNAMAGLDIRFPFVFRPEFVWVAVELGEGRSAGEVRLVDRRALAQIEVRREEPVHRDEAIGAHPRSKPQELHAAAFEPRIGSAVLPKDHADPRR